MKCKCGCEQEVKTKGRNYTLGHNPNSGFKKGCNHKGKKNGFYNNKHTQEYKNNMRKIKLNKLKDEKTKIKISETLKEKYKTGKIKPKNGMLNRKQSDETKRLISLANTGIKNSFYGKTHTIENKQKLRIIRQKQILENGGGPNIGKNETQELNKWEKIIGYKILRQYPICGYFLDGYCKELNIAFEVDEKAHTKKIKEDKIRQSNIEKELNCKFLRIKDYE